MTFFRSTSRANTQSGNILIYILGAIFLLGLLIITVRGSSTPGNNIDEEELILRVAEVQQFGAELENAISFILQKGFSELDIRFGHPDAAAGYGLITDTPERQVFDRNGGGAIYRTPPNNIQTIVTIGDTGNILDGQKEGCFEGGGTPTTGTFHYYRVLLVR